MNFNCLLLPVWETASTGLIAASCGVWVDIGTMDQKKT